MCYCWQGALIILRISGVVRLGIRGVHGTENIAGARVTRTLGLSLRKCQRVTDKDIHLSMRELGVVNSMLGMGPDIFFSGRLASSIIFSSGQVGPSSRPS